MRTTETRWSDKSKERLLGARRLLVPLVEGLLSLLHGLVDTKEVLVAEGVDGLGLVELLRGTPAVLEPHACRLQSTRISDWAESHCPYPIFTMSDRHAVEDTDYQGWHSPSSLAGILARSASISSSKGGIGVSENFGITLKISLTMSA